MSELSQAIDTMRDMREAYNALVENMPSAEAMKMQYSARFEENNDGDDTYTCVLPLVAGVEAGESEDEVIMTI